QPQLPVGGFPVRPDRVQIASPKSPCPLTSTDSPGRDVLIVLALAVVFLAYTNGANDNFKGVATLFGSGTAKYRTALAWATVTTLAGSLLALYLAAGLVDAFSGKGLVP